MIDLEFHVWAHVLVYMYRHRDNTFSAMAMCKELNISSTSSVSANTKLLEKYSLITVERNGRYNDYKFTKEGLILAEYFDKIFTMLEISRRPE